MIGYNLSQGPRWAGNNDVRVPVLNTGSTFERVPLSKSLNFAGSTEPIEHVLKRPLQFPNINIIPLVKRKGVSFILTIFPKHFWNK